MQLGLHNSFTLLGFFQILCHWSTIHRQDAVWYYNTYMSECLLLVKQSSQQNTPQYPVTVCRADLLNMAIRMNNNTAF